MPLIHKIIDDKDIELAIWRTVEPKDYFHKKIEIHPTERSIIDHLSERKKLEWYSSRFLLHLMSGRSQRGEFTKDIHGKPHLMDSDYHISISHSDDLVAVVASKLLVGIDIQFYVSKIHRIRHKFVNPEELVQIPEERTLEALHVIWGAKESLYKAYGKRALDFRKHIQIFDLKINSNSGEFHGKVIKEDYKKDFLIRYYLFKKYVLVYAKECS